MPQGSGFIWSVFLELCATRSLGMMGANPITYLEIEAYQRLTELRLTPVEVRTILALDALTRDPAING